MESQICLEDRRVRRTKNLLKRSFIELLEQKPYEKITVKDIVEYADFNRTTFYNYYKYKEELVDEILDETMEELSNTITLLNRKRTHKFLWKDITIFNYVLKYKNLYKLWKHSDPIPGFSDTFIYTIIKALKNHYLFKDEFGRENEMSIIMLAYGTYGIILKWVREDFSTSPRILAESYVKFLNRIYERSFYRNKTVL